MDIQDWTSAQLTVSATPSVTYCPQWSTTFDPIFPETAYAKLVMEVNIICLVFDDSQPNWNFLESFSSPVSTIYSVDQYTGSYNTGIPIPTTQNFPVTLTGVEIFSNCNYGIFVQFQAWTSAFGASTGTWVPGSWVDAWLNATVSSMDIGASVIIPV